MTCRRAASLLERRSCSARAADLQLSQQHVSELVEDVFVVCLADGMFADDLLRGLVTAVD